MAIVQVGSQFQSDAPLDSLQWHVDNAAIPQGQGVGDFQPGGVGFDGFGTPITPGIDDFASGKVTTGSIERQQGSKIFLAAFQRAGVTDPNATVRQSAGLPGFKPEKHGFNKFISKAAPIIVLGSAALAGGFALAGVGAGAGAAGAGEGATAAAGAAGGAAGGTGLTATAAEGGLAAGVGTTTAGTGLTATAAEGGLSAGFATSGATVGLNAGLAAGTSLAPGFFSMELFEPFLEIGLEQFGPSVAESFTTEAVAAPAAEQSAVVTADAAGASEAATTTAAEQVAGVSTDPMTHLYDGSGLSAELAAGAPKEGLIQGVMKFAKDNPLLTKGILDIGGGILKGIGDSGLQDDKQQHEKDLLTQKLAQDKDLMEWKRRFIQGGSFFDAKLPFSAPSEQRQLLRPDGTPVHSGLLGREMR